MRLLHIAVDRHPDEVLTELEQEGVDVRERVAAGQLQVRSAGDAYLSGGSFDLTAMVELLGDEVEAAHADGWSGFRVLGEMAWALRRPVGVAELIEYERAVDAVFRETGAAAACLYDARRFDHAALDEIAELHPLVLSEPVTVPYAAWQSARIERRPDGALALCGEVERAQARSVAVALRREAARDTSLRLDLSELAFIDVRGLTALAQVGAELGRAGGSMVLLHAPSIVRTTLSLITEAEHPWLRWEAA